MRCREALNRLNRADPERILDRKLLKHLRKCPACARQAEAARQLQDAFAQAEPPDTVDRVDWSEQVRRVEAEVARLGSPSSRETTIMSKITRQFKLRPRLSASLTVAVLVLLGATLIPLKFDQTIGFEVAVAGVNRDLALNQERLQEMLTRLGLQDAAVNVIGCEETCNLVVSDLQHAEDARIIKIAFERAGSDQVLVELKSVQEGVSNSALEYAAQNVWFSADCDVPEGELVNIVIERLGDDFCEEGNLFFTDQAGNTLELCAEDMEGHGAALWVAESGSDTGCEQMTIDVCLSAAQLEEGGLFFTGDSHDPACAALIQEGSIVDGKLTDEARNAMQAMGYTVEETVGPDGELIIKLIKDDSGLEKIVEFAPGPDAVDDATKEAELPEGFTLSQNYPNPFNPTTQIEYSLPRTEQVSLEIFNINGQRVRTLVEETMPPGHHTVEWNATDDHGDRVASGVYLYRLTAGEITTSKKMTLVK